MPSLTPRALLRAFVRRGQRLQRDVVTRDQILHAFTTRPLEGVIGLLLAAIGAWLLVPMNTFETTSAYAAFRLSETAVGVGLLGYGLIRVAASRDQYWLLRVALVLVGLAVHASMVMAVAAGNPTSTALAFFGSLALLEVFVLYRFARTYLYAYAPQVLYIEDDPGSAYQVRLLIEEQVGADYELVVCRTFAEGLAVARSRRLSLAILDLGLPDTTPAEAHYQLRKALHPRTPMFLLGAPTHFAADEVVHKDQLQERLGALLSATLAPRRKDAIAP